MCGGDTRRTLLKSKIRDEMGLTVGLIRLWNNESRGHIVLNFLNLLLVEYFRGKVLKGLWEVRGVKNRHFQEFVFNCSIHGEK